MELSDERDRQLDLEHGKLAHDRHAAEWHAIQRSAFDFALEAIRTAALINGGAVIACFAFLGSLYDAPDHLALVQRLMMPAMMFAFGAIMSGVSSIFAYFTQYVTVNFKTAAVYQFKYPYVIENEDSRARGWISFWHAMATFSVIASYAFLIVGLYFAGRAIWP